MSKKKISMVSLFCGAGGLDMGFENQRFQTVWANDFDKDACATHREWSDAEVVQGDIGKIDFKSIPRTDFIAGGFPCQGFSLAGPRKIDDSRNILYRYFVKLVEEKQPKAFVAENVKVLLTLGDGAIIEALKDFGEPLDDEICMAPYSSRYMSRNRKRSWNEQSFTIPAMAKQVTLHPESPDMIKIGPDKWKFGSTGKTRRLSYKEAAAIQTFPKSLVFHGDLTSKYKQIGNAVPENLPKQLLEKSINEEIKYGKSRNNR